MCVQSHWPLLSIMRHMPAARTLMLCARSAMICTSHFNTSYSNTRMWPQAHSNVEQHVDDAPHVLQLQAPQAGRSACSCKWLQAHLVAEQHADDTPHALQAREARG
jgi:hypothetical protein